MIAPSRRFMRRSAVMSPRNIVIMTAALLIVVGCVLIIIVLTLNASGGRHARPGSSPGEPSIDHFVTPEEFGAAGNGVTDDARALQSALNHGHGRPLRLARNRTYLSRAPLVLPSEAKIVGSGESSTIRFECCSTPAHSTSVSAYMHTKVTLSSGKNSNVILRHFHVIGSGSGVPSGPNSENPTGLWAGVMLIDVRNFVVSHLEVERTPGIGIVYSGASKGRLSNNFVHNTGRDGITGIWNPVGGLADISLSWNRVARVGDDGIAINGTPLYEVNTSELASQVTVFRNRIEGWRSSPNDNALGRGIALQGIRNARVLSNRIDSTAGPGILIAGCRPRTCAAQSIDPETGSPWQSYEVEVLGNHITSAGKLHSRFEAAVQAGILVANSEHVSVGLNHIVGSQGSPVTLLRCRSCSVRR